MRCCLAQTQQDGTSQIPSRCEMLFYFLVVPILTSQVIYEQDLVQDQLQIDPKRKSWLQILVSSPFTPC